MRVSQEKREEALAKEALLLERQQLLDEVAEVKHEEPSPSPKPKPKR